MAQLGPLAQWLSQATVRKVVGWSRLQAGPREALQPGLLMRLSAGFSSLLAGGRRPPSSPAPWASPQIPSPRMTEERDRGQAEPQSFCDLTLEATAHHFCYIFSLEMGCQVQPVLLGWGIIMLLMGPASDFMGFNSR